MPPSAQRRLLRDARDPTAALTCSICGARDAALGTACLKGPFINTRRIGTAKG